MTRRAHDSGEGGFTLLEVLVAVSLLGVALVSLLGLHARDLRLAARSQDLTLAGLLAARVVADTRARSAPEVGVTQGSFATSRDQPPSTSTPYGGPQAARVVWRREVEPTGLVKLRRVRISVGREQQQPLAQLEFLLRIGAP